MITFLLFRGMVIIISAMPFLWLYPVSDVLSYLLGNIFRYRRTLVIAQLKRAFPQKAPSEIQQIARESYRNVTDILLESLKAFSMNRADFLARYHLDNPEVAAKFYENGQKVIILAPHYANWEWGVISLPLHFRCPVAAVYRPLKNKQIEQALFQLRTRFGHDIRPNSQTSLAFEAYQHTPFIMFMMPDGSPASIDKAHWVNFLGQDTAAIYGPAKHSLNNNCPLLYLDNTRIQRGFYSLHLEVLCENPQNFSPQEITTLFMERLEKKIRQNPQDWLWTHNRWKKKRNKLD